MSVIAATYQNAIVNYLRGAGAPPSISAAYLDLYNGDPTAGGVSVLLTITGSATRQSITSSMTAAAAGISTTTGITVTTGAVGSANITHVCLFNASTGGNLVLSNNLASPVSVSVFDPVQFDASHLTISLS